MKVYKLYRKTMRRLARFILSFERCPVDCRKNYKELLITTIDIIIVSLIFIFLLGAFVLITM